MSLAGNGRSYRSDRKGLSFTRSLDSQEFSRHEFSLERLNSCESSYSVMALRTDKTSGLLMLVIGIALTCFASVGLAMVVLQRAVALSMAAQQNSEEASFLSALDAIYGVWIIYLPMMVAGGFIFVICGFYVRQGSMVARRVAQIAAICSYAWIIAYAMSSYRIAAAISQAIKILPEPVGVAFLWLSIAATILISAAIPTAILYSLGRSRSHTAER